MPESRKFSNTLLQLHSEVDQLETLIELIRSNKPNMSDPNPTAIESTNRQLQQTPIAIVGMASLFPQSRNLQEYWQTIIQGQDCITQVPPSRWNVDDYYDPDPSTPDKTYCKRGGFIPEIDFNPMEFGLPPNQLEVTDVSQLLALIVAKDALEDAGYQDKPFDREHTGVILGVALARQLTMPLAARLQYPVWEKVLKSSGISDADTAKIIERIKQAYVDWEPNAFPGMLANVVAGRIANRFDLGGMNCIVDAACASSFGALSMAISELTSGRANMMLTGGVDTDNSIVAYMCFSKTPAISRSQQTKPFDADSDGMMLGEGVGMLVLKRLSDAEQDNNKIYAVIRGVGSSSDGRHKSIYAPRPEGQMRALRRAYESAGFAPSTVRAIEAHGTGTMAGDPAEFAALKTVFGQDNSAKGQIAIGSVKSQIGHTKAAAGAASLIKTALALHHKVLPPTINVTKPHPKLEIEHSPFYLNTKSRPWLNPEGLPRRAGVSSFGFGGTNYHIVLEEHRSEHQQAYRLHHTPQAILLAAATAAELLEQCQASLEQLRSETGKQHFDQLVEQTKTREIATDAARLGFVAASVTEAETKLQRAIACCQRQPQAQHWQHPSGIFYRQTGLNTKGKVVALFSGQSSQYLEMGRELALNFPCWRETYSQIDRLFEQDGMDSISGTVYPPPVFDTEQRQQHSATLQQTEIAQPAIAAFSVGLYKILQQAGFKPDFVAGHSFGELTALWAAGVLGEADYFSLVKQRGLAMATPATDTEAGAMLAVKGDVSQIEQIIQEFQVAIANWNSPQQVVLAGDKQEIVRLQAVLDAQGYSAMLLPVSAAFHTRRVQHAQKPFAQAVDAVSFKPPQIPVYSNLSGNPYPQEPQACQTILKQHLLAQVQFQQEIENIYAAGGTCFVEFGPRSILTHLVGEILGDRDHVAVALNPSRQKDSDLQLREAVIQLRVAGLSLPNLDPYQVIPAPLAKPHPLNVRLSSVNYVSETTKKTFEQALQAASLESNGTKNEANTSTASISQTQESTSMKDQSIVSSESEATQSSAGNSSGGCFEQAQIVTTANGRSPSLWSEVPLERVLASLEYSLTQFNQHQQETLEVHKQYLHYQSQYAKTFFELMQQQNQLWTNLPSAPQEIEIKTAILTSAERSLNQFQAHQSETLQVHQQYLNHQAEYAKNFFYLSQQSYSQLLEGSFKLSGVESEAIALDRVNGVVAARTKEAIAEPVTSNGNGNGHHLESNFVATEAATSNGNSNGHQLESNFVATEAATSNGNGNGHHLEPKLIEASSLPSLSNSTTTIPSTTLPEIDFELLSQTLLNVVSEKTGYPTEMLELDMDMEADLGIDSIKRVEILGALQEQMPDLPQPNLEDLGELRTLNQIIEYLQSFSDHPGKETLVEAEPANSVSAEIKTESIREMFLASVSQTTGYPLRTLNLDMEMEADLGIDAIACQKMMDLLGEKMPDAKQRQPEWGELVTLGQVIEYFDADTTQKKTFPHLVG